MMLLHPAALALFATAALLIFVAFLQSRTQQQAVSSLDLWVGLTPVHEHQKPRLHRWVDPLLFLQLLALAALVFIVTEPVRRGEEATIRGLALIVDESASMQTREGSGSTRFESAIERARDLLAEAAATRIALIEFSSQSHVVVPPTGDAAAVRRALDEVEPSWLADGAAADLLDLVSAVGGLESYDRIVLLTDSVPPDLPGAVEVETFGGGRNVGITAFSVRENPLGPGVSAFLELYNETDQFLEPRVTIRDEFTAITVALPLDAGSTERYVSPFPSSRGVRFTVTMDADDGFPIDDVRYFALARPASLQVRWIGGDNRFLRAALESTLPIQEVEPSAPADLTVVVGTALDELPPGNVLLLASEVTAVNRFTSTRGSGNAVAEDATSPLLAGVEAGGIYVETLPETLFVVPASTILSAGGLPLLSAWEADGRSVFIFSTDLRSTNLAITVDFPLLIRNLVTAIARVPGPLVHEWRTAGELLTPEGPGELRRALSPDGTVVELVANQSSIIAEEPGFYTLETAQGAHIVAVNVPPGESLRAPGSAEPPSAVSASPSTSREVLVRLWPLLAWIAVALVAAEAVLHIRVDAARRAR